MRTPIVSVNNTALVNALYTSSLPYLKCDDSHCSEDDSHNDET